MSMVAAKAAETMTIDTVRMEVEPLVTDDFSGDLDNWIVEGNSRVWIENGKLRIDTPEKGYATVWHRTPFDGNHLIRFRARVLPPRQASNVNFFFCASLPDGGGFFDQERSGKYAEYHKINNYTMTFTGRREDTDARGRLRAPGYMRLRKNPGFNLVDETLDFKADIEQDYDVSILKVGMRIKVFVNGVPALDWWDYGETADRGAHAGGYAGFRTFWSRLELDDFAVYRVNSWKMTAIEALKDLRLETNLSQASIVSGSAPAHHQAARTIAAAVKARSGRDPQMITDAEAITSLPARAPLVVIGNLADNEVVRRLYLEWRCLADRKFPGENGYIIQTIHNPWGAGSNVVLVGASDDTGLAAGARGLAELIPEGARIGRIYEVKPADDYAKLREWDQQKPGERLIVPVGWPLHFALFNYGSREDPRQNGLVYLLTGDDSRAETYREQMLKQVDKGIIGHLYIPSWMIVWDLMEEHPVFSDEDRLKITNWFLDQLRSQECIGALHIQRLHTVIPHQNHGTRPALGTFLIARYFKTNYALPEADVYLNRIARYFDMQADWSKPMCDSSMHQWEATLEDKAIYALASGNDRFFSSGAARQAAERALRTTNNVGLLPVIGDAAYGAGASSLLAKAAFYYQDGRYLWPMSVRENVERADTDELARGFVGDLQVVEPTNIVGVSVIPYDKGFWKGWRNLPSHSFFNPPNIPYEKAFDKIAFRTGLDRTDEFLLLDGMVGASHDYDDTNTIHEYSRNGRPYLVTCDGLFASTFAWHNGVNIIRDGLSTEAPYFAERLHAADLGAVMVSQTRVNDFSEADWTRTIALIPGRYFVVIDHLLARKAGTFSFTGHWHTLGEPDVRGDTLTLGQWPRGEKPGDGNATYFHLQTPAHRVAHERLAYLRHGRGVRYYPYARPEPNRLAQAKTSSLEEGASEFLYTLGHETGELPEARFALHDVAPGVVRVAGDDYAAYTGAPGGPVSLGCVSIDADLFHLDADHLTVAGGRRVAVADTVLIEAEQAMTATIELRTGRVIAGEAGGAQLTALDDQSCAVLRDQLLSERFDRPSGSATGQQSGAPLEALWEFDAGGRVAYLRGYLGNPGADARNRDKLPLPAELGVVAVPSQAGHISFLDAAGEVVKRIEVGVPANDVAVDDIDRDGSLEVLIARQDSRLQCLSAEGEERFAFAPQQERFVNSQLYLPRNPAVYVFVADRDGRGAKTICVTTGDQRLHGLNPAGERQWLFWSYAGIWTRHGLYDLDQDGAKEIVGGNGDISSSDCLFFLDGRNVFAKRILNDGWGAALTSMAIGDINSDGRDEIVIGTRRTSVHAIDPSREGYLWSHKLGHEVTGCEIIRDEDARPLVVAGCRSQFIVAFDGAGRKRWATPVAAPVELMAMLGDENGVVAALKDGTVVLLSVSGEITHHANIAARPTALTVVGPDHDLILLAGEDGVVRALRAPHR